MRSQIGAQMPASRKPSNGNSIWDRYPILRHGNGPAAPRAGHRRAVSSVRLPSHHAASDRQARSRSRREPRTSVRYQALPCPRPYGDSRRLGKEMTAAPLGLAGRTISSQGAATPLSDRSIIARLVERSVNISLSSCGTGSGVPFGHKVMRFVAAGFRADMGKAAASAPVAPKARKRRRSSIQPATCV